MAKQPTIKGAIRPQSDTTRVSLATLEKRIRRHLAGECLQLRKNRPGTYQFAEHGTWSVVDPRSGRILERRFSLEELGRRIGVLAEHEALDTPQPAGWVWRVVRQRSVIEDGKPVIRYEPLGQEFASQEEAYQAAAKIGGADLAVIGYAPGAEAPNGH